MKYCKPLLSILGFAFASLVAATAADVPALTFKFTTINVPGAIQTAPSGVNNLGVTVGVYQDKNLDWHGYILDGKNLTKLDDPNGINTGVGGLNPNGAVAVVGSYLNSGGMWVGFLYKNGKFTDIAGPTDATATFPSGINDRGAIVGTYRDSIGVPHGFLLEGTTYTTLDVPGASATVAMGINSKGCVVLVWTDSKGTAESSLYDGKTYKTIDVPGATNSYASGLNAVGDVVYEWFGSSSFQHGALLRGGKYYKFGHPKSLQTYGGGINDRHVIVGGYQITREDAYQGFKATYK
jgi:uncharacterized membrane protein